ncbi:MAG TPA: hypothetical protein VJ044_15165 [Candidatus Hodarchaeales archaeon]|nr:hypothetical protein [Candidatus Hodarchaeales archaeon]
MSETDTIWLPRPEDRIKKIERIIGQLLQDYSTLKITKCAVIHSGNGLPVFVYSRGKDGDSGNIITALAAGSLQTGNFVSNKLGFDVRATLDVLFMGEHGHTAFVRHMFLPEFIILTSNSNNTQAGSTLRFSRVLVRELAIMDK